MGVLIWLISLFISLFVLYWIITTAIDSSDLAKDIKEIKQLLKSQNQNTFNSAPQSLSAHAPSENEDEVALQENCPACGEKVWSTDKVCGSCGLTLIAE